ncbi:hypothetical protein L2U69_05615 [Zavarzinia compransoris]|uniref:hypothetical protein n=1 Tax=Zavarzinia marina TaxID=2911065 RepID=UPI001F476CCD|nr:hypothetical protein [Zavarzinia marina]MCF4165112.1 hypothetical protein [Zavarzinia marina]
MKHPFAVLVAITTLLAGCAPTPPLPPATVSTISTIAVVIAPKSTVRVSHRGITVFGNDGTSYDAKEWGIDEMKVAALRRNLEPRFKLVVIPAPAIDEDDMLSDSYSGRVESIVVPAMAGSGVKADAILFFNLYKSVAFPDIGWQFSGCGIYDISRPFADESLARAYCVGDIHIIDPVTMKDMANGSLSAGDGTHAAVEVISNLGFESVHLTPGQIEKAKAAIAAALDHYVPIALHKTGLIP